MSKNLANFLSQRKMENALGPAKLKDIRRGWADSFEEEDDEEAETGATDSVVALPEDSEVEDPEVEDPAAKVEEKAPEDTAVQPEQKTE